MKAFIPAAGLGTRLKPLTNDRPKALVPILGKALIDHVVENLISQGINEFVINVHHFPNLIRSHIESWDYPGIIFHISDESDLLMDTGGGILKAKPFLEDSDPFLVYNVDILSDIDVNRMLDYHKKSEALITMATRNRETSRSLMITKQGKLCGWKNNITGEQKICFDDEFITLAFSGIHIISQDIWERSEMPELMPFSIINLYLELARNGASLMSFQHDEDYWMDVGRYEQIPAVESFLESFR